MTSKPPALPPRKAPGPPDPRVNPWRSDLAARSLEGVVESPRYVDGTSKRVAWPIAALRQQPAPNSGLNTELLFGEAVTVYEEAGGWSWVQAEFDRYVGYVPAEALQPAASAPTHVVSAIGTFLYPSPDIKQPPLAQLSLGSLLAVAERQERFSRLATGGYVVNRHIGDSGKFARDFVEIAERFIGTPYLWGGRSRIGTDCSGLVQTSLKAAGVFAPRDSDMQEAQLGLRLKLTDGFDGLQRGDLVFWKGHVGIMLDGVMMLHANAHHMAVVVETLEEAAARIAKTGTPVSSIKRLGTKGKAVAP